jgi:hypothetical protein
LSIKEAKLLDEDPESRLLIETIRLKAADRYAFSLSTVTNMLHLFTTCRARERKPSPLSMTPALVLENHGCVRRRKDDKVILCPDLLAVSEPLFCLGLPRTLRSQLRSEFKVQASSLTQVYLYRSRVLRQRTHNLEVYCGNLPRFFLHTKEKCDLHESAPWQAA